MLTLETFALLDAANVAPDAPAPGQTPAGTSNVADAGNLGSPAPASAPKPTSGAIPPPTIFPVLIADPQADRAGTERRRRPGSTATGLAPEPKVGPELRASTGDQGGRGFVSLNRPGAGIVAVSATADGLRAGGGVVATTVDQTPAQGAAATSRTPLLVLAALVAGLGWVLTQ
jgi:hypothetical protein